ncbi:MAG TPA: DUF1801 domain-containing protein [Brevundimonas sp.]|jgi:uncharacterized protein YdhG (YjbR/CyaY superfamily)
MATPPADIDAYLAGLAGDHATAGQAVRAAILEAAPGASETIRYGMPAFQIGGATIIYFAVWKKHIGLYPIYRGDADYEAALAAYRSKTDTVNLPLAEPLPVELIGRIVRSQIALARA